MRRHALLVSAVVAAFVTGSAGVLTGAAGEAAAATKCRDAVRADVVYSRHDGVPALANSLDVYPAPGACNSAPTPIVVWVHGGGWSVGDKRDVGAKLGLFHDLGAAVVSVNYRLSAPPAPGRGAPVQHPDHANDVADAVAWVAEHAPSFGGDAERIVLVGHSAGGHLVSLVGADPGFLRTAGAPTGSVDCVVALDTEGYDLEGKVALGGASERLVRRVFGDDAAVWRDASPVTHLRDGASVAYLVVTRGSLHRLAEADRFVDAVHANGGDATLLVAHGYTHADVNRRLGVAGESVVTPAVREFVEDCTG